jgi:hypothetical protein|nr:MAG TPA: Methylglyoxal synthase [Caudoviricetes sp.]
MIKNNLADNRLSSWKELLESLGFESRYFGYLDSELTDIDWYAKDGLHLVTHTRYTEEYCDFLRNTLKEGDEFEIDWSQCEVTGVSIKTDEFGYQGGRFESEGYTLVWKGEIHLTSNNSTENFNSFTYENFMKALYMARNPIAAKNKIALGYIKETEKFLEKHCKMLSDLGWKQYSSTFLPVGAAISETEPYITFRHPNGHNLWELDFRYNMFTEKLIYNRSEKTDNPLRPYKWYEQNVNEMSTDELKEQVLNYMKEHFMI